MCDAVASPRQCVQAEGFPRYPRGACVGYGESRSAPPCSELLSPVRTISGSTQDTATTPSPRRNTSRFIWADEDDDDEELLPEAPARWKPNAHALEFIPTTSMDCVMVGFAPAGLPGPAGKAAEAASTQPSRRRGRGAARGRPAPICTVFARPAAEALASPRGCSKGPSDMPEATEEEWEHRAHLRMRAVEIGKESKEYRLHCETKKGCGHGASDEPKTPDPHDRTISKRMWKFLLREWRSALEQERHDLQEGHGSVVSTEEWQSSAGAAPTEEPESSAAICGDSDSESTSDL